MDPVDSAHTSSTCVGDHSPRGDTSSPAPSFFVFSIVGQLCGCWCRDDRDNFRSLFVVQ